MAVKEFKSVDDVRNSHDLLIVDRLTAGVSNLLCDCVKQSYTYVGDELGSNPLPNEVQAVSSVQDIAGFFKKLGVSDKDYILLESELNSWKTTEGKSESAKRNTLVKWMIWGSRLKRMFAIKSACTDIVFICTSYNGKITSYFLNWLVQCGVTVLLYLSDSCDVISLGSQLRLLNDTTKEIGYTPIADLKRLEDCKKCEVSLADVTSAGLDDLDIARGVQNCVEYKGVASDKTSYCNMLYNFRKTLDDAHIVYKIVEGDIKNANPADIEKDISDHYNDIHCLDDIFKYVQVTSKEKQAFRSVVSEYNIVGSSNIISLFCIYRRYKFIEQKKGYFILLTDLLGKKGLYLLDILMQLGVSVIVLNPSKSAITLPNEFKVIDSVDSMAVKKYPISLSVQSARTVASQAEEVIQAELYGTGIGIYKDMQFSTANVVMLDTTFEEIEQLWGTELRFRQGFNDSDATCVTLPVIHAKLSGVPFNTLADYNKWLGKLKADNVLVYKDTNASLHSDEMVYIAGLLKLGTKELDFDKVSKSRFYKYRYLKENTQRYIVDKITELLNYDIIDGVFKSGVENTVCSVLFNLPDRVLNLLQSFDFTKKNPKVIFLWTSRDEMQLETTILINFLSLVGFDILYVVPTGYNILNRYLKTQLYKEYEFGNYDYSGKVGVGVKSSIIDRIFRR